MLSDPANEDERAVKMEIFVKIEYELSRQFKKSPKFSKYYHSIYGILILILKDL